MLKWAKNSKFPVRFKYEYESNHFMLVGYKMPAKYLCYSTWRLTAYAPSQVWLRVLNKPIKRARLKVESMKRKLI